MSCRLVSTGDKGQRFEIRYTHTNGEEKVVGWCAKKRRAQEMAQGFSLAPYAAKVWVVDRQALTVQKLYLELQTLIDMGFGDSAIAILADSQNEDYEPDAAGGVSVWETALKVGRTPDGRVTILGELDAGHPAIIDRLSNDYTGI